jgi:hypothetical protein
LGDVNASETGGVSVTVLKRHSVDTIPFIGTMARHLKTLPKWKATMDQMKMSELLNQEEMSSQNKSSRRKER